MVKVKFQNTGAEVEAEAGTPLKAITTAQSWPVAYGCGNGLCGTCIIHVSEGKENMSEMDEMEEQTLEMMCMQDGDHRLACRCQVNGDVAFEGM